MTEMYFFFFRSIFTCRFEYFIITSYCGKFNMLHIFEIIILKVAIWIILKYGM